MILDFRFMILDFAKRLAYAGWILDFAKRLVYAGWIDREYSVTSLGDLILGFFIPPILYRWF